MKNSKRINNKKNGFILRFKKSKKKRSGAKHSEKGNKMPKSGTDGRHGFESHQPMDTNEKNTRARSLYAKLGYNEADIVGCTFNGIRGINLVCLEKLITSV